MGGCRPLSPAEIDRVEFTGPYAARDRLLFQMGQATGYRISELLSLKVRDVWDGELLAEVTVARRSMKGKHTSRTVPLSPRLAAPLKAWIEEMERRGWLAAQAPLFRSPKGDALDRRSAWRLYKAAFARAGVRGRTGTHTTRKTFARRIWERSGRDIMAVKRALGHANLNSTASYLQADDDALASLIRDW